MTNPFGERYPMAKKVAHFSLHPSSEPASATTGSASCYGRSEDVFAHAVIVSEFKLRDVERKIFLADFMKCTDHPTLKDRPKAIDDVGMHCADHVLSMRVVDDFVRILLMQLALAHPLIGNQQADIIGHGFIHKAGQGFLFHVGNHASHNATLALNPNPVALKRDLFPSDQRPF
jgi:hypothetical protein